MSHERDGSRQGVRRDSARPREPGLASRFWARVGVVLVGVSFVLWGALPIIPFLPLDPATRVGLGATVFLVMEVVWWAGLAMTGPAAARRLTKWWRLRAASDPDEPVDRGGTTPDTEPRP